MDFITDDDLDKIASCAEQEVNDTDFNGLKKIYEKLEHLCKELQKKGFEYTIRKDPRKQAGQGLFQFQHYQWAKIYPPGLKQICHDKFSYILTLSDVMHFHMMGIKDYQELPPSKTASNICWTEIDVSDLISTL